MCMRWYFIVVSTCISVTIRDVDHLFICLLAMYMSSLEICLLRSFAHCFSLIFWGVFPQLYCGIIHFFGDKSIFKIWLLMFLLLSCRSSLYILDINLLSDIWFPIIFSHSGGCLFTLFIASFDVQKFKCVIWCHLSIVAFVAVLFMSNLRNHCQIQYHKAFPLCFLLVL